MSGVYKVTLTYTALVVAEDSCDAEHLAREERTEICCDIEPEIESQGDIITLEELKAMKIGWNGRDYPYGDEGEKRLEEILPEKLEPVRCDKTGDMFPDELPEPNPCFQSMAAAKKLGADPAWRWCIGEALDAGGILLHGAVPNVTPDGGRRFQGLKLQRVAVTSEEIKAAKAEWSRETGKCGDCYGTGQRTVAWSMKDGVTTKPCEHCHGTGRFGATEPVLCQHCDNTMCAGTGIYEGRKCDGIPF